MFGLFQNTPTYRGAVPPAPRGSGGLFGFMSRVLGDATPSYRGAGQPASGQAGLTSWFPRTPTYRVPEPAVTPALQPHPGDEDVPEDIIIESDASEDEPFVLEQGGPLRAPLPLTIIVRRSCADGVPSPTAD